MKKFLILTDSIGNPRSFPVSEVTQLEETYPYLLRDHFKDAVFGQLSFGNLTTEELIDQAIGYLSHWDPDFIIIHSGINDCRPEPYGEFQRTLINQLRGPFFGRLKTFLYHPGIIKHRQLYRVPKKSFQKTLKKFKLIFSRSTILWLEICSAPGYEKERPGIKGRILEYNKIIEEVYGNGLVRTGQKIADNNGFNIDNLHWTKNGHKVVAEMLITRINSSAKVDSHAH